MTDSSYRFAVVALGYEHVSRTVDVAADDSVMIDVRLAGVAYCEETITIDDRP